MIIGIISSIGVDDLDCVLLPLVQQLFWWWCAPADSQSVLNDSVGRKHPQQTVLLTDQQTQFYLQNLLCKTANEGFWDKFCCKFSLVLVMANRATFKTETCSNFSIKWTQVARSVLNWFFYSLKSWGFIPKTWVFNGLKKISSTQWWCFGGKKRGGALDKYLVWSHCIHRLGLAVLPSKFFL